MRDAQNAKVGGINCLTECRLLGNFIIKDRTMARIAFLLMIAVIPALSQTSYVKDWLILGTFPNAEANSRLSRDYLVGETSLSPRGGEVVEGRQWVLYHSPQDFIDFLWSDLEFGVRERCVVYAAFFVQSPSPQTVRLLVGSDDGIAVWCNGKRNHFADVVRGLVVDDDTVSLDLIAGWNTVVLKVANAEGGFGASARFADGNGLILSAQNPFPPQRPLSPSHLVSKSGALSFRYSLTDHPSVAISMELPLFNAGSASARTAELQYSSAGKTLSSGPVPEIAGGELKSAVTILPFGETMLQAESGAPLSVRLQYEGRDTTLSFVFSELLLSKFFEPWQLDGWKVRRVDEKTEGLNRVIVVPEDLQGLSLQFAVDIGDYWGSVTVNGISKLPRFSGDSGELELSPQARTGERFEIEVSVKTEKPVGLKALVSSGFRPRHDRIERYLQDARFAKAIYGIDGRDQSVTSSRVLTRLRTRNYEGLDKELEPFQNRIAPYAAQAQQVSLHMIGNAHIDMAWLWRYPETIEVTRATFQSALDNLGRYPDFRFSHGQAQSYDWIEQTYPEMFREIQKYVKEGRWEIVGGTWVESDGNMPSGESFVRQYLYGKHYFKSRFGVDVRHGYHPDTFGHAATLPQILSKSGIDTYTFFRPGEDERIFWWETPDGSRVLAHHPSNWYGTWSGIPDTVWTSAKNSSEKFAVHDVIQYFGVGDHGGGPTRRQIEQIGQLSKVQLYPKTAMSSFGSFYDNLLPQVGNASVQRGEQNFVFEGCYTSQAMIKQNNRKAEALLPTAEMFSSIAAQYGYTYPSSEIEDAWYKVLFNQFHDVMCGSGIHDVALDAGQFYAEAFEKANKILSGALQVIGRHVNTKGLAKNGTPVLIFNPLNWTRSEPVELMVRNNPGEEPRVLDAKAKEVASQVIARTEDSVKIVFQAKDVPSIGYATYWIFTRKAAVPVLSRELTLENKFFRVQVDPKSGCVSGIFDKLRSRELVQEGRLLNEMQIQEDDAPMSAWVIGLRGDVRPLHDASSVKVVESGKVRKVIRSEYSFEMSSFAQEVVLYEDRPLVEFRFSGDWKHRKRALKIAFPLALDKPKATFDIPFGSIERPTDGREVVGQKWVDLSEQNLGVTLLNESKYGFDVKENVIRMTALRSPTDPDPKADEGHHEFRYALYAHTGSPQIGGTVQKGFEFNTPVVSLLTDRHQGDLPSSFSFIQMDNPDAFISTLKKSEDDDDLVIRLYEASGRISQTKISVWHPIATTKETDLMEWNPRPMVPSNSNANILELALKPTEIKTLKFSLGKQR
jgi:alpha-mannosidase